MRRFALLFAAATFALGCSDSSGPDPVNIDGRWTGQANIGVAATLTITLNESDGDVTANGSLTGGGESFALTGTGTWAEPDLSITLTAPGFEPLDLSATYRESDGDEEFRGLLNGSGFQGELIILTRQ